MEKGNMHRWVLFAAIVPNSGLHLHGRYKLRTSVVFLDIFGVPLQTFLEDSPQYVPLERLSSSG